MSSQFVIEESWLEHEGGTKFYHPIRLMHMSASGTKVVTAVHFAGFKGDFEKYRRPVKGGQVQIKGIDHYQRQIEVKRKGGYIPEPTSRGPTRFDRETDFRMEVIRMFGRADSDVIFSHLGLQMGDAESVQDLTEAELRPKTPGEDTSIEDFTERPAAWGSW